MATRRSIHVIQLMHLRRSHSAIIKSTHTYVSARVAYDGTELVVRRKIIVHWAVSWIHYQDARESSNLVPNGRRRLTHLFSPHPLMIKHPLDIGKGCRLVWEPKKINRRPFPLDSDLSLHQQTRHLQSTDLSEIPLAQPWPLKSTAY